MKHVTIYTDGACRGNPGPGGYGCVLLYEDKSGETHRLEKSGGFRLTTNNRMEIYALVAALEALKTPCLVDLYSDSQYVINAFEKGWLAKWKSFGWYKDAKRKEKAKNVDLWQRLETAMAPHEITFHWVKGHAMNAENNRCDELAVEAALDRSGWAEDTEFQKEE